MKFLILSISFGMYLFGSIGDVVALKGEALLNRDAQMFSLGSGMEIMQGDVIRTKDKTRVQVMLLDNTVVTIGANSTFQFDSFVFDGTEKSEVSMGASRGFFRTVTGEIGKIAPERFKVKTVSATIGIRGTDFSGEIFTDKELIKCYVGRIMVEFEGGFREIDAGMMIELIPDHIDVRDIKPGAMDESGSEEKTEPAAASPLKYETQEIKIITQDLPDVAQIVNDVYNEPEIHDKEPLPEPFSITPEGVEREMKF